MGALRLVRPLRFRASHILRAGGADDAKPRWSIPEKDYHKYTYQPSIPDKHFYTAHWNYAPITMWLRARRPYMEHVIADVASTLKTTAYALWSPVQASADKHLPGFGWKVLGVVGALLGYNIGVKCVLDETEAYMFLEKMHLYSVGEELVKQGFFASDAEDAEKRQEGFDQTVARLETLWETAFQEALKAKSFEKLCEYLVVDAENPPIQDIPVPLSWRFSMMPYGRDNPDTKTTGFAPSDTPAESSFFLGDMGSTGDYIDRQDNKPNPIRKGRHMYTSAYIPPTK